MARGQRRGPRARGAVSAVAVEAAAAATSCVGCAILIATGTGVTWAVRMTSGACDGANAAAEATKSMRQVTERIGAIPERLIALLIVEELLIVIIATSN